MIATPAEILRQPTSGTPKPCRECGEQFVPDFLPHLVHVCQVCSDKHAIEEGKRLAAQAQVFHARKWEEICPTAYRETDVTRLPRRDMLTRIMRWQFGPRGLLLHGPTGQGKSRCAWLLLKREHDAGRRVLAFDHSIGFRYAELFAQSAAEATAWIDRLSRAEILFLDDVFKARLTDSLEAALHCVIATRCDEHRPLIISTNDTGESLAGRMSEDRSAPLIRRLTDYTDRISFVRATA